LPFVPVLKGGGNEQTVRRALIQLQQNEQLVELESLLGFFASFVLGTELVQQIMRWEMTVLRESPWYLEIRQEGIAEGEQRGEQVGEQRGRTEEARSLVLRLLARRVGTLPADVATQVQALALQQLEALGEALLDFASAEDLSVWLQRNL
jgi:predicted transposase YdaD